jgi:hypothetical protein
MPSRRGAGACVCVLYVFVFIVFALCFVAHTHARTHTHAHKHEHKTQTHQNTHTHMHTHTHSHTYTHTKKHEHLLLRRAFSGAAVWPAAPTRVAAAEVAAPPARPTAAAWPGKSGESGMGRALQGESIPCAGAQAPVPATAAARGDGRPPAQPRAASPSVPARVPVPSPARVQPVPARVQPN